VIGSHSHSTCTLPPYTFQDLTDHVPFPSHSLCPSLGGTNFVDPENPTFTMRECQFLKLSSVLDSKSLKQPFQFKLPHLVELDQEMGKKLGYHRSGRVRFPLPPTFGEEHHSKIQTLFVPWKEPMRARVHYTIKVIVTLNAKPGVGRLLGSTRQKR
jgi:hypothetical protein